MYGNEHSQYTMNRAAYGDVAASMMMGGGTIYGGAAHGMQNMLSDVGGMIMPVGYTPPARVNVGFYGQYRQSTGFMSGAGAMMGFGNPGRSQMASDYLYHTGADFGERVGGGIGGVAATVGGMGIGSLMGRFMGGGILGSLAGGMAGSAIAGVVLDAVGQRREINSFVEQTSFRYMSPGSTGADARRGGMSAQGRQNVTDFMRQMDFKDPTMSTEDLTMILQQGSQKGMFAGSGDMEGFKKKFKDLTETVKVVTRTLGQTLDEAMSTIKELKSIGIDPTQAKSVIGSADSMGRMAGRTGAEMLNIGLQGAELFRGTGVNMAIGAQASMMNLASVRASRDAGLLSTEAVAQAGGEEALALRMNASGLAFGQSQLGRGFGAAFFSPGMGMGGFNQGGFMAQMMGGGMGLTGMAMQAAGNLSNPAALISYQANQEKFMSEAGKTFGGKGLQMMQSHVAMAQADYLSQATGAKFEDSYRLSLKQMGMSQSEIEANLAETRGAGSIFQKANAAANVTYQRAATEESFRSNTFYMMGSQIRDDLKTVVDAVARPVENVVESVKQGMIGWHEEQIGGVRRYDVSGMSLDRKLGKGSSKGITARNLDKGGWLGGVTAGEGLYRALVESGMSDDLIEVSGESALKEGQVLIKNSTFGKSYAVNLSQLEKKVDKWNFSADDVKRAQEAGTLPKGGTLMDMLGSGISGNNMDALAKAAFGKSADDLTREEAMRIADSVKGTVYEGAIKKSQQVGRAMDNAVRSASVETMISAKQTYDSAADTLRGRMNIAGVADSGKLSSKSVELVAMIATATDPKEKEKLQLQAQASMLSDGFEQGAAKAMIQKGMVDGVTSKTLVDSHDHIVEMNRQIGSSALTRSMVRSAKESDMTSDEIRSVEGVAIKLAGAKSPDEFMALANSNESIIKKSGSAGARIVDTASILKKIESGDIDTGKELLDAGAKLGVKIDDSLTDLARSKSPAAKKELMDKILSLVQASEASPAGISSGAGTSPEGGSNAAAAFDQQMNINREVLAAMSVIARKLGAK